MMSGVSISTVSTGALRRKPTGWSMPSTPSQRERPPLPPMKGSTTLTWRWPVRSSTEAMEMMPACPDPAATSPPGTAWSRQPRIAS